MPNPAFIQYAGKERKWDHLLQSMAIDGMTGPPDFDAALAGLRAGDKAALDAVLPALYAELRRIAEACLAGERPDHTLQPTALVHEAYMRLLGQHHVDWSCRPQVLGLAARMMRRILVNHAEARNAQKRGGGFRIPLDDQLELMESGQLDVQSLDLALNRLEAIDERQARIVELRFFSGLSVEDTAAAMEVSTATIKREWRTARLWLVRELDSARP
jgi:RNA polymerase sigma-70 factor, ECF subfamily